MMTEKKFEFVCVMPNVFGVGRDEEAAIVQALHRCSKPTMEFIKIYKFYQGGWKMDGMGYLTWTKGKDIGEVLENDECTVKERIKRIIEEQLGTASKCMEMLGHDVASEKLYEQSMDAYDL
jgi:hypothetical protein